MNIDVSLFTITTVLLAAALATVAWMWARLRKRVKASTSMTAVTMLHTRKPLFVQAFFIVISLLLRSDQGTMVSPFLPKPLSYWP